MRIHRFYVAQALSINQTLLLSDEVTHHIKVLRIRIGETVCLFNGNGSDYFAQLQQLNRQQAEMKVLTEEANLCESPLSVHLAQAIARGEKMDWVIQKSTELGVSEITPLLTENCNVKLPQERLINKVEHWQKVAISASEQSGRAKVPKVHMPQSLSAWLEQHKNQINFLLSPKANQDIKSRSQNLKSCGLLIGPEGGFSQQELSLANEGYQLFPLALGPRILRTETAGMAAISILQSLWGDF